MPRVAHSPRCPIRVLTISVAIALLLAGCRRLSSRKSADEAGISPRLEDPEGDDSGRFNAAIAAWNLKHESAELRAITSVPVAGHPDLLGAICDYEGQWWGFMTVYGVEEDAIVWQAECENQPGEQSVREMRALALHGIPNPVFEVFGQTHMGNGGLYLYELRGRKLVLLLETRAVDDHDDRYTYKGGLLSPCYRDIDLDGYDDLDLTGTVVDKGEDDGDTIEGEEGIIRRDPVSEFPCRKVFFWDQDLGHFVENPDYRTGLENEEEWDASERLGR
ncbi:MAG: hypothetical protein AAB074_15740 [Planctomycetota bacterium]